MRDLWRAVDVPVIGIGGIQGVDDVMEYLLAGASAVQIGTANYYNPRVGIGTRRGLPRCIRELGRLLGARRSSGRSRTPRLTPAPGHALAGACGSATLAGLNRTQSP